MKQNKVPPNLYSQIANDKDIEEFLKQFYCHIINRVKQRIVWPNKPELTKKQARWELACYSISRQYQNAMLNDMEARGFIKQVSCKRGSKVRIL